MVLIMSRYLLQMCHILYASHSHAFENMSNSPLLCSPPFPSILPHFLPFPPIFPPFSHSPHFSTDVRGVGDLRIGVPRSLVIPDSIQSKLKKMRNAPWDIDYKIKFDLCHQQHHGTVHQGLIECPKSATMF